MRLLPCGLVYIGMAGAAATSNIWKGSLFVALFGAGTLPMMFLLPLARSVVTISFRNKIQRVMPLLITGMALLFILRGINLGIPYLSPRIENENISCHSPLKVGEIKCSPTNLKNNKSIHK